MSRSDSDGIDKEPLWESELLIDPVDLQAGHFVSRLDRPWRDTPFPLAGVMILSDDQLAWFREECKWLVIDLLRSRNGYQPPSARAYTPKPRPASGTSSTPSRAIDMLRNSRLDAESVTEAVDCHDLLYRQAASLIDALQRTGIVDAEQARLGLRKIASSLETNVAAMIWLTRIKHADRYTAEHCVNVAILAMGLARALEWADHEVENAGLAGLLHDVGKMKLDPGIVHKPGPLTDQEYRYVQQHPQIGYELLSADDRILPEVARAVLGHHERPDGTGYPSGHGREMLQPLAALVGVVDAYDSMVSEWPYRTPISHHEALGELWRGRNRQFDTGMVETLIRFLGWITPGVVVSLSSDEYAVVLQTSHEHRLWPIVRKLRQAGNEYIAAERVDLAEFNRNVGASSLRIVRVLPDGALEVDLNAILLAEAVRDADGL
ncbi:MAG: HD-GYP domain-containing protein [Wenzhouxiangellaceae bacterium]|nr:HD-GYP domain-containing protein [Wenzhouxiangellaceae bacterium]